MQHHYFKNGKTPDPYVKESLEAGIDFIYTEKFRKTIKEYEIKTNKSDKVEYDL